METLRYLGHHWSYRNAPGDPQLTFNYVKALSDYMTNFVFGKGVGFTTPEETAAIVPYLLRRVWHTDNVAQKILWETGNLGGVSGDVFVKVAYEEPYVDPVGRPHNGKVRILPLNPAQCFPVDQTEILTRRGWLTYDQLKIGDQTLGLDPETDEVTWADVEAINVFDHDGPLHRFENERFSALTTPDHRWVFDTKRGKRTIRTSAEIANTTASGSIVLSGGTLLHFPTEKKWDDDFVELIGWVVSEGHLSKGNASFVINQCREANPDNCARLNRLAAVYCKQGLTVTYSEPEGRTTSNWYFPAELGHEVRAVLVVNKGIDPQFLTSLTFHQAELLFNTLMDGDGDVRRARGEYLWQDNWEVLDSFQMLAAMLGNHSQIRLKERMYAQYDEPKFAGTGTVYKNRRVWQKDMKQTTEHYTGKVWCPTTSTGTWTVRFKEVVPGGSSGRKMCYITGNCFP